MTIRPQIPSLTGIDPKVAAVLRPMRDILRDLDASAVRSSALGAGLIFRSGRLQVDAGTLPPVPSAASDAFSREVDGRVAQLEEQQTEASRIAEELLGTANFGTLIGDLATRARTLKVNVNGHIAGYGFAVRGGGAAAATSDFIIQADRFAVVFPSPPWQPDTVYALGQYVTATDDGGVTADVIFECTNSGTSGSAEPTWDETIGNTTADNGVVWTARAINERVPFVVGQVDGNTEVGINGDLIVDGTILARHIVAGSIDTDQLAANAVTAAKVNVGSVESVLNALNLLNGPAEANADSTAGNPQPPSWLSSLIDSPHIAAEAIIAEKLASVLIYAGSIVIDTSGHIRSGQTAFNTGIGWFVGNNSGTSVLSMGNPNGHYLAWDGSGLEVAGASGETGVFNGSFNSSGIVPCKWIKTLDGILLTINTQSFDDTNTAAGDGRLILDGLPASITPSSDQRVTVFGLIATDNSFNGLLGTALVQTDGTIEFKLLGPTAAADDRIVELTFPTVGSTGFRPKVTLAYSL